MKIKNSQIVGFYNSGLSILQQKIPRGLFTALSLTAEALQKPAAIYEQQRTEILEQYVEKDAEGKMLIKNDRYVFTDEEAYDREMNELQGIESDIHIQTIPEETINLIDAGDKYDALTGAQYAAIDFMIEKR